jgi:hypothetical protein
MRATLKVVGFTSASAAEFVAIALATIVPAKVIDAARTLIFLPLEIWEFTVEPFDYAGVLV